MREPMVLYLVRHGRTRLNAGGMVRGHLDEPLDAVGRDEAERLGHAFADVPLAVVLSSPLVRAKDTAAPIARTARLGVVVDDRLLDRDYGPVTGELVTDVEARFGSLDAAPGVEPMAEVARRLLAAVNEACTEAAGRAIVLVGHDATNRAVLAALVPSLRPAADIPQRTGCWNRLERGPDGWAATDVDRLPGEGADP